MTGKSSLLMIRLLPSPNTRNWESAEAAERLRHGLLQLDVEYVELAVADENIAGSKGFQREIGVLLVWFALRPDGLRNIVSYVRRWADSQWLGNVKLICHGDGLEITKQNSSEQESVINQWIDHHASSE